MKTLFASFVLTLLVISPAGAELLSPESARQVGDRAPIFSLVDDQGELIEYDKAYYGRHHLILTFFPAAFTPV